ncbi:hypothetical protein [Peredibacter starrii]|uniref:Uncharacterized protein n=1 Tax=Peredibacter starrii TaxID=28202 RepID=A0AAX4HTN8_9BACT|nr:hypothetical protein [Peredibacter starrii]WPU66577.1 hypothetical protein SOO65_07450 [Peredibacter starrii]
MKAYFEIFKSQGFWSSKPEDIDRILLSKSDDQIQELVGAIQKYYISNDVEPINADHALITQDIDILNCDGFLKRALLLYETIVIQDPIPSFDPSLKSKIEIRSNEENPQYIRNKITLCLKWLVTNEKLVTSKIIVLSPEKYISKNNEAVRSSLIYMEQLLPEGPTDLVINSNQDFLKFCLENADVFPITFEPDGGKKRHWDKFDVPHNIISIDFKNDPRYVPSSIYQLFEINNVPKDGNNTFDIFLPMQDPGLVERSKYERWRNDSILKVGLKRVKSLEYGLRLAEFQNGILFTESTFEWGLLNNFMAHPKKEEAKLANIISNMNLPFLGNVKFQNIVKLRSNEESFFNFRSMMKQACKSVELTKPSDFVQVAHDIEKDLIRPEFARIKAEYKSIQKKYLSLATIEMATFYLSASTGGLSLIASLLAAGKMVPDIMNDIRDYQRNNVYMLWKLKEENSKAHTASNILL